MLWPEPLWYRIVIITLNLVSIMGCSIIIWTFYKLPKLNNNPCKIVLRITILSLIFSLMLLLSQFYLIPTIIDAQHPQDQPYATFQLSKRLCGGLGMLTTLVQTLYNLYNVLLVLHICSIMSKKSERFNAHFCKCEIIAFLLSFVAALIPFYSDQLSEGLLGNCYLTQYSTIQLIFSYTSLFLLITLFIIILVILYKINMPNVNDIEPDTSSRKTLIKFQVLYSLVFTVTRGEEIFLFIIWIFSGPRFTETLAKMAFLVIVSVSGILLFIIRINEPLVNKFLRKIFTFGQNQKLIGKLNINETVASSESSLGFPLLQPKNDIQSLEITVYSDSCRQTLEDRLRRLDTPNLDSLYLSIKSVGELMQILVAINFAMSQQEDKVIEDERQIRPYLFKQIVQRNILLKHNPKELESMLKKIKRHSEQIEGGSVNSQKRKKSIEYKLDDYIDLYHEQGAQSQPACNQLGCFSYAQEFFKTQIRNAFSVPKEQLRQSLEVNNNFESLFKIKDNKEINILGTIFITQDGLISIDLISTSQKARLIHGDGLLRLYKRQREGQMDSSELTILPAIIGLHSIQLDKKRCVNILVKLNPIRINYPLCQSGWDNQCWRNKFANKNIIGWVTINNEFTSTRFLANSVVDGLFSIKLNESDFKISEESKIKLIQVLYQDLPILTTFSSSYELNFVYIKFCSQRLNSMYLHEQKKEQEKNILRHVTSQTEILGGYKKLVLKFALDSKIGYMKVFFSELWSSDIKKSEQEIQQDIEDLVARVNDFI